MEKKKIILNFNFQYFKGKPDSNVRIFNRGNLSIIYTYNSLGLYLQI